MDVIIRARKRFRINQKATGPTIVRSMSTTARFTANAGASTNALNARGGDMKPLEGIFYTVAIFFMVTMMFWALFTAVSDNQEYVARYQSDRRKVGQHCVVNGHGFLKTSHARGK